MSMSKADLARLLAEMGRSAEPLDEEHQRRLEAVLLAVMQQRWRARRAIWLSIGITAASFVLLLGFAARVDSNGFNRHFLGLSPQGALIYRPEHDRDSVRVVVAHDPYDTSLEQGRQLAELTYRSACAGHQKMTGIQGMTVGGETAFLPRYACQGYERTSAPRPCNVYTAGRSAKLEEILLSDDYPLLLRMIQAGHAHIVGAEDRFVGGRGVHFLKYAARLPRWGTVIFWDGTFS